ncbi:MAG: hypothetical protein IT198_02265 [Acidimicrobiia bacterium]|nr:hypothetical protein [Acidimicrobiia bacterium]
MPNGDPLPDEILLSRDEAGSILFALDDAADALGSDPELRRRLEVAAQIIVEKFLPDVPDL